MSLTTIPQTEKQLIVSGTPSEIIKYARDFWNNVLEKDVACIACLSDDTFQYWPDDKKDDTFCFDDITVTMVEQE